MGGDSAGAPAADQTANHQPASHWIGRSLERREGPDKLTGRAKYVDDLVFPGMIHGVTVRSSVARGRVRGIEYPNGFPWDEIIRVAASDIPGKNAVTLLLEDQPFLASEVVNHPEEPILLLAHPDRRLLEEARRAIRIEIDPLPAVFSIEDALARRERVWGEDNVFKSYRVEKGDVDQVWSRAHRVFEGEYRTGAQEHLYIEPNGMIADASPGTGVTVWGSMQCPYYVHKALVPLFGLPADRVRVVQCETGGGFGGKEEYPSLLAGHAALLSWKAGRPVKMIYDRAEDMAATTKRHPSRTRHRTAVDSEGRLLAMEIDFALDGGAYCTLSPVVLSRGTIHAAGPYRCDHVRIRSRVVATNHPPHGAFRGFGAPQSLFATERHMDVIAREMGIAPEEIRRRNFLREGDTTATGQVIRESLDLPGLLDRALEKADYHAKRRACAATQGDKKQPARGLGVAAFLHGAGFTGSGERYLASRVACEATPEGRVRVLTANTEIGQGMVTVFTQIAAEALGSAPELVEVAQPDTSRVPNSGPTVASRTTMIVGGLVGKAARAIRETLEKASLAVSADGIREFLARHGTLRCEVGYEAPDGVFWDDEKYRGDAYGTFAWAVYVAEVAVDPITCEAKVEDFVAMQEVGRVVNPTLAEGQIEGGVAQGIGWALSEKVEWRDGRMANCQMTNYIVPTSMDTPPIRVFFEERPYAHGPGGAKGIGELPLDGPAPAILNAIHDATGVSFNEVPLLPEAILEGLGGGIA